MTNYSAKDVDEYIAAAPAEARSHLEELRATVKSAVPEAEESISWGKPYSNIMACWQDLTLTKITLALKYGPIRLKMTIAKHLKQKGIKLRRECFTYDMTKTCQRQ